MVKIARMDNYDAYLDLKWMELQPEFVLDSIALDGRTHRMAHKSYFTSSSSNQVQVVDDFFGVKPELGKLIVNRSDKRNYICTQVNPVRWTVLMASYPMIISVGHGGS